MNQRLKKCLAAAGAAAMFFTSVPFSAQAAPGLEVLTEAQWDAVGSFSEGLAWVKQGELYSFIDTSGQKVLDWFDPFDYVAPEINADWLESARLDKANIKVGNFHDGFVSITYGDIRVLAGTDGQRLIPSAPGTILSDFSDGLAMFATEAGENAYIDKSGNISTVPIDLDMLTPLLAERFGGTPGVLSPYGQNNIFSEGYSAVGLWYAVMGVNGVPVRFSQDDLYYVLIDRAGNFIPKTYKRVLPFNEGLAPAMQETGGKIGFIDVTGEFVIPPQFDDVAMTNTSYKPAAFIDGLARVKKDNKWGVIDKAGNLVGDYTRDAAPEIFSDGMSILQEGEVQGYLGSDNQVAVQPSFMDVLSFYDGAALVANNPTEYVIIDKTGGIIANDIWYFDAADSSPTQPDSVFYERDGLLGLARFQGLGGEAPIYAEPAADIVEQPVDLVITDMPTADQPAENVPADPVITDMPAADQPAENVPVDQVITDMPTADQPAENVPADPAVTDTPAVQVEMGTPASTPSFANTAVNTPVFNPVENVEVVERPAAMPADTPSFAQNVTPEPKTEPQINPQEMSGALSAVQTGPIFINNAVVSMEAYGIGDGCYIKLRDLAFGLIGTGGSFNVGWDEALGVIGITTGIEYAPIGNEMIISANVTAQAFNTPAAISLNGYSISLDAYSVNGETYFDLFGLCEWLGVRAEYGSGGIFITAN